MVGEERGQAGWEAGTPSWRRTLRLLLADRIALAAMLFLLLLAAATAAAPALLGPEALRQNLAMRNLPPSFLGGPPDHWLGTDQLGRDLAGRLLLGARVSLGISGTVVLLSLLVGVVLGGLAGYYGGTLDSLIMRTVDVIMSFPSLLLAIIVLYVAGASVTNLILVLAFTRWTLYTRLVRAEVLRIREFAYVEAARALGCPDRVIISRHIAPNLMPALFSLGTLELAQVILSESSLSYLGLGLQPPSVSWGLMVAQGQAYMGTAWWLVVLPGAAILLCSIALNLLATWLGLVLDPTQRGRLGAARIASRAGRSVSAPSA